MVGEHRPQERRHRLAPVENPSNRRVERVLRPSFGQQQERPAFLQMPGSRTFPATGCPAFRLKARVQLSDVVKERQGGESLARRFRQRGARRRFQAVADDGQLQHSREHRRHVHGVMSERMKLATLLVGLAPSLEHQAQIPCGIVIVLMPSLRQSKAGHVQLHVRRPDFRLLRAIAVEISVDSKSPERTRNPIRQQNRSCTPLFNRSDRREGRWRR